MKLLLALLLLTQVPAKTLEIRPGDFPEPGPMPYQIYHESNLVATFLYTIPDKSFDARCVIIYPRKGSLGWLIDRKENEAHLFYLQAPWPEFCKK